MRNTAYLLILQRILRPKHEFSQIQAAAVILIGELAVLRLNYKLTPSPDIPEKELRERCSTILSQAAEEARKLGHNYIGTEHLFIAATRNESDGSPR